MVILVVPRVSSCANRALSSYKRTHCPMRPRTQTTRTNHLGYDAGSSRKIPDGALARSATAECLKANKSNALTRLALTLFARRQAE